MAAPPARSKLDLACALVALVAERDPDRRIHLVGDAASAGRALRELPTRATVTTRLRADAALYQLSPPRTGRPGRLRTKGDRLPELTVLAALVKARWQQATVRCYDREHPPNGPHPATNKQHRQNRQQPPVGAGQKAVGDLLVGVTP